MSIKLITAEEINNLIDENRKLKNQSSALKSELKAVKALKADVWDKYLKLMNEYKELELSVKLTK